MDSSEIGRDVGRRFSEENVGKVGPGDGGENCGNIGEVDPT